MLRVHVYLTINANIDILFFLRKLKLIHSFVETVRLKFTRSIYRNNGLHEIIMISGPNSHASYEGSDYGRKKNCITHKRNFDIGTFIFRMSDQRKHFIVLILI